MMMPQPPRNLGFLSLLLCMTLVQQALSQIIRTRQNAEAMKSCLAEGQRFQITSWNTSVLEDALPNLVLQEVWWSVKAPAINLTVITQLSVDRLPTLEEQCKTFHGPFSAAVYLPLVQPISQGTTQLNKNNQQKLADEAAKIQALHDRTEADSGCQLDVMLFYEVFDEFTSTQLYPVNALRNFARMQARTQLLSAIDVDMMISPGLSQDLMEPGWMAEVEQLALSKVAMVLPALEPTRAGAVGRAIADNAAAAPKAAIGELMKQKHLQQFKLKVFPRGHTPTNYTRWLTASQPYPVTYQRMFEPWFITHWDVMPWFDVNFKGYGLNKIVHVASLNFYGFTFQVLPNAWLVHRPHEDTAVRKAVTRQASDVNKLNVRLPQHALYNKVTMLFGAAKRDMVRGEYAPRLDPRMVHCMSTLPWLQPFKELTSTPVDPSLFAIVGPVNPVSGSTATHRKLL